MTISPAPRGIQHELEIFGSYNGSDKASNDELRYDFHLWMEKDKPHDLFGEIQLPFTCTTENKLFCIYKSETETEEGGMLIFFPFIQCVCTIVSTLL